MLDSLADQLDRDLAPLSAGDRLVALRKSVPGRIVFTTSLGLEDQVLTHLVAEAGLDIEFATLDTGRLFPETYDLWERTEARYGIAIRGFSPDRVSLEQLVAEQGINGFRASVENRKTCCDVRKVEPLERALAGAAAWITGLRADQSAHRGGFSHVSADPARGLVKVNPLIDWSREEARLFAEKHDIPVNALHEKGFLSIGCAPCTRAIRPGEAERAGRWWWEDEAKKECGLHIGPDGRLTRAPQITEATA